MRSAGFEPAKALSQPVSSKPLGKVCPKPIPFDHSGNSA